MLVSELDADKNPVRGYVLGNEYISQVNGTSFGYYLNDEQGSVRYLTGSDGSIRNHYRYSAFGETITAEETVPNRLRYNGQMADGLTGLYYLRARYYNASLGRFTQEDVIYNDGLNLYAYCNSNPVMYSDPSGFAKQCDPKVGGEKDSKGSGASRPGGYVAEDIDKHGLLSPNENRAKGNHNIKSENQIQSHHPIQDAWAQKWAKKNGINYNRNEAAAILLPSNSGMSHAKISAFQRARRRIEGFDTAIGYEFNVGYRELIDAGVNKGQAKKAIRRAYKYFDSIGAFDI